MKGTLLIGLSLSLICVSGNAAALSAPLWIQGGHAARISGVACSPDGTRIASSSEDGTVRLWSTNGLLLRTLNTQPYPTTAIAWSPDGTRIAAGTYCGGSISSGFSGSKPGAGLTYLWQATSGWENGASLVRVTTNRYGKVTTLAFSADSTLLASGCAAGSNIVNSVADGSVVRTRPAYNISVGPAAATSVAFSSAGLMASGCEDGMVRVYSSTGNLLWSSSVAHSSNVTAVAFSSNGSFLATASLDRTIRIWSTADWSQTQTFTGHDDGVTSVAFSPDGQKVVSGSVDGIVKTWLVSSGGCLWTITAHELPVTAAIFSPDGTRIISGSDDQTVRLWSAEDGSAILNLGDQRDYVGSMAFSPDGSLCASAGGDSMIPVRSAINGSLACALAGHAGHVSAVAFGPDSSILASGGGPLDPTIKLWKLSDGSLIRTIEASSNGVSALAFSPDGSILASGGDFSEQVIRLWNVSDGTLNKTLAGHSNGVTTLAFSQDGTRLVSGGRRFDNTVKVWDVVSGELTRSLSGHAWNIESVAFSPDGSSVASGSSGSNPLAVWSLAAGSPRYFGSGTGPIVAVAFTPDGSTLAAANGNAVQFWNVASGTLAETATAETTRPSCVVYSPNGNLFLFGREDGAMAMSTNTRGALGRPPFEFTRLDVEPGGATTINASVQPGTHYLLWFSTNLTDWSFVTSAMSGTDSLALPGSSTSNAPAGFYRATTPP